MEELRKGFHHELDEVRLSLARLAASVIEAIPRATNVLLSGDLEGAEYLILADDEIVPTSEAKLMTPPTLFSQINELAAVRTPPSLG